MLPHLDSRVRAGSHKPRVFILAHRVPHGACASVAVADRAVRANPALPEALFNRALSLESLTLTKEAFRAWQDVVALDSGSPWAAEARVHVDAVKP